ncbi:hypothetical protein Rs2_11002 [Raphanus sativus]|nr:blue copper protein-like [Raphanus sativus]XP_056862404.1 blue copper protein-like [Raphanus sativus]KAJ4869865.1 hypothetical protein Rs2_48563 [Raphanus sativus]KAJ4907344.1 hypothetical protein Rs2_11002 [Raphanus sativus]
MTLLIAALSLMGLARATSFYEVGDTNGWTTKMGLDYYKTWSSSKTFYVGDSLIFQYKHLHNVLEVSFEDYESCNPNSALTTYHSEYEPVKLNRTGHYYFICGVPGHCESGQKLEVLVVAPASLQNTPATTTQQNNSSTSNSNPKPNPTCPDPKPEPSPPWEDPLEVLPVDAATIASLPHNAASDPCVWSGLSILSFLLLQTLVFL